MEPHAYRRHDETDGYKPESRDYRKGAAQNAAPFVAISSSPVQHREIIPFFLSHGRYVLARHVLYIDRTGKIFPGCVHKRGRRETVNSALYIGATGMKAHAEGLNTVSNNLANVSTVGFKQQSIQFSDIFYAGQSAMGDWWNTQENSFVALGQTGMGVQVDSVRTLFTDGGYESSNTLTDLSLSGKGFFQVTDTEGNAFYTRAGDFRFDNQGFLTLPAGHRLTGYKVDAEGNKGAAGPIQVDPDATLPGKGTSMITMPLNLGLTEDRASSTENPYFGMLEAWDSSSQPPLGSSSYGYSESLSVYDGDGTRKNLTVYFDGAPDSLGGKTVEFLVGGDGEALMSGTLRFDSSGQLVDMTAFTPNGGDPKDLTSWTPASLEGGVPRFTYNGQTISLDMGIQAQSGWQNSPASAADVKTDQALLGSMGTISRSAEVTTGYNGASSSLGSRQDGYGEGTISDLEITANGKVVAQFSNGQSQTLYEIPVCRFTSEDGLRREGNNLFSATDAAGAMEMGTAGTENYASIQAYSLELSNVDMAREMVNMIITQRGFQSNSKAITTADTMLQKAIELKRN